MDYIDLAPDRTAGHSGDASQRILSDDHDRVGLAGEFAFGEFSGLWPDTTIRRGGDKGIDFTVRLKFTVDVKTFRNPHNLIHEQGKIRADIYVLGGYDDDTGKASLIGWESGTILQGAPVRDFGAGIMTHYIAADQLRPMDDLKKRLSP